MSIHRLRLRETTTSVGYADFQIEASDPQAAVRILQSAYQSARAQGVPLIIVGAGQARTIEAEAAGSITVTFHLVDESGDATAVLPAPNGSPA